MALPREERASLAHDLLDSLLEFDDLAADLELRQEIESRLRDFESGRVQAVDAFESLNRLGAKYASHSNAAGS